MAVRMGGQVDFTGCDCDDDLHDLIEVLNDINDDDVIPEMTSWGYPMVGSNPITLKLPCGGTVRFEWDLGLGVILGGWC